MPYNPITMRFKEAVRDALAALSLPGGFTDDSIAVRPTPSASGLTPPAIVVSGGRNNRKASPAGCRVRELAAIVSIYFAPNTAGAPNAAGVIEQDTQEQVVGLIEAAFDIPPTMPAAITSGVPEAQELRVRSADSYLPAQFRYFVGGHRIAIVAEVCQTAGVA